MYNLKRLEWHQGVEKCLEPRRVLCGLVVRQASLLILFNRLAVALAKSQDHRASCGVFAFGRPSDSRYVTGPAWGDKSRNTDSRTHPLICRTALVERLLKNWVQRWKQGPIYKRINPTLALGQCLLIKMNHDECRTRQTLERAG